MDDALLTLLRCPIDPDRQATLTRDNQRLLCSHCYVSFPIKQGLPVLIPDEGTLPPGVEDLSQLPCQRKVLGAKSTVQ